MNFLTSLIPFAKPVLGALGGIIKSTIGDIAPKLFGNLAESAASSLAQKVGIPLPENYGNKQPGEHVQLAIEDARNTLKRKSKELACANEQKKIRVLENKLLNLQEEERRRNFEELPKQDFEL